jgi:dephospho-CoA kinase
MTKNTIIGFVGFIGSGKDTAADYLVNTHEFRRDSFANTLKDAVAAVFGWDRILLEGRTKEAREWREKVDPWWAERLNMPNLTPRWILQYWGTEVCRHGFHDDIWIASVENKLRNTTDNIVISDVRFPNEIAAIKKQGGLIICIERGVKPHWYDIAIQANRGTESAIEWLKENNIHASETAWVGDHIDFVVSNDSTIDKLCEQINNVLLAKPDLPFATRIALDLV